MDEYSNIRSKPRKSKGAQKSNKTEFVSRIKVTIEKKKQCSAKALEIVTKFSEETVDETCLIENLGLISQEHYDDVVEERAINRMCGYPLCGRLLDLGSIPAKQFHISTVHNKVFDITDRKKFCSNLCYKASRCLREQVSSSPVWLRDSADAPAVTLIPLHSKGGITGDEVDLGVDGSLKAELEIISKGDSDNCDELHQTSCKASEKENKNVIRLECPSNDSLCAPQRVERGEGHSMSQNVSFSDSSLVNEDVNTISEPHASSDEHLPNPLNSNDGNTAEQTDRVSESSSDPRTVAEGCVCECEQQSADVRAKTIQSEGSNTTNKPSNERRDGSIITQHKPRTRPKDGKKNVQNLASNIKNLVLKVEHILKEWFSFESLCFVFGEEKVKEMVSEKQQLKNLPCFTTTGAVGDAHFYERYLSICRKLNILEIEDSKLDASFREEQRKPLPDYDLLKEEAKELDLKVKMFYNGDRVMFSESSEAQPQPAADDREPVVPLVDLHAQKALRRRIVLDKLKRILGDVQSSLGLRGFQLLEAVRSMVGTFTLSAHNVTMRPLEWNLVVIVIIKLVSLREPSLAAALQCSGPSKQLTLLLLSYSLDTLYLDRLVAWLTDIDYLINKS